MARPKLRHGFLGGLLGGLVFAGIMVIHSTLGRSGMLDFPRIGQLVGAESAWVGFLVLMVNSSVLGIGYVLVFGRIEKGMVDGLRLGTIWGAACWFLGPLTLLPLSLGVCVFRNIASRLFRHHSPIAGPPACRAFPGYAGIRAVSPPCGQMMTNPRTV